METGDYQAIANVITHLNSPLKDSPLPEVNLVQMAEFMTRHRACQLAEDQRVNLHTDSKYARG